MNNQDLADELPLATPSKWTNFGYRYHCDKCNGYFPLSEATPDKRSQRYSVCPLCNSRLAKPIDAGGNGVQADANKVVRMAGRSSEFRIAALGNYGKILADVDDVFARAKKAILCDWCQRTLLPIREAFPDNPLAYRLPPPIPDRKCDICEDCGRKVSTALAWMAEYDHEYHQRQVKKLQAEEYYLWTGRVDDSWRPCPPPTESPTGAPLSGAAT